MRKRNLNLIASNIVMVVVLLLPIILICLSAKTIDLADVIDYANTNWVGIMDGVPMYSILQDIIGPHGTIPLVPTGLPILVDYMAWCFTAFALALLVKIVIFIPRMCGALIEHFGGRIDD